MYLELLSTLCICKGVAIPDNQKEVSEQLVNKRKGYLYRFELTPDGQVCVWKRMRKEAVLLADLIRVIMAIQTVLGPYSHKIPVCQGTQYFRWLVSLALFN